MGAGALLWFVVLDALLMVVMHTYEALGDPSAALRSQVRTYTLSVAFIGAASLCLWGTIWLLCIAFREDFSQGLMCLLIPFYSLFYAMQRWQERRGPLGLSLAPVAWILLSLGIGGAVGFFQGMVRGINRASQQASAMPATPGNHLGPIPSGFSPGVGPNGLRANAAAVRRAEAQIRANIRAIRKMSKAMSKVHDLRSAKANEGNFSASVAGVRSVHIQNQVSSLRLGKNEIIALKHLVGAELCAAYAEFKQETMRISAIVQIPAHLTDETMAQVDQVIDQWTIKPGEETMPELVEPQPRTIPGLSPGMPGPFPTGPPPGSPFPFLPPGPPNENVVDHLQRDYDSVRQRFGDQTVAILVSGLPTSGNPPTDDVAVALDRRIKDLAPETQEGRAVTIGNRWATVVAPVNDRQGLIDRIDFGTVKVVGFRIEVQLDPHWTARVPRRAIVAKQETQPQPQPPLRQPEPEPEFPPGADAITRSLIQLKSSDIHKKKQAIERLERSTPDGRVDQVVQALIPLLDHDDGFLVQAVEKALAVWRSPEAMAGLIARTRDNRHFVRSEAIKALGKYQDLRAAEAVVEVIKDDGFATETALKEMGSIAEPAVIPLLRNGDSHLRSTACDILAVIGGLETLQTMQSLPADPDFGVRVAAQRAATAIIARVGPLPKPARGDKSGNGRSTRN